MTEVVKEFATPDRAPAQSSADHADKKDSLANGDPVTGALEKRKPTTVTPPESASREELSKKEGRESPLQRVATEIESPEDRKVRFDREMANTKADSAVDSPSSTSSQRGLVSRRGGRCASPGRVAAKPSAPKETVLEFKTYRSPPRKKDASDTEPTTSQAKSPENGASVPIKKEEDVGASSSAKVNDASVKIKKEDDVGTSSSAEEKNSGPLPTRQRGDEQNSAKPGDGRKNNVSFSPVPPREPERTPTKSPSGGRFQSLPTLDDETLRSPGSFLLSPHPPTPSTTLRASESFDKTDIPKETAGSAKEDKAAPLERQPLRSPKTPRSPRTPRRDEREAFLTTPTDFAMDYGKHMNSGYLDSSNVLSWLQSPTANGLFSPGGFGSILNTPRGAPRTPRTPTVSTSFFFSDVAGLPQSTDVSPKPGAEAGKRGGSRSMSNIICISPLASSKTKNGSSQPSYTPTINYKEMFASPEKARGLPLLGDSPAKAHKTRGRGSASRDPNLDAVHMAERDLMEDEDLSRLLRLANNTPLANGDRPVAVSTSDGTHVFRSPERHREGEAGDENLPSLQLPIIGGRDREGNGTRLSRKTHSRDHGEASEEFHPMGVRSSGSGSAKEQHRGRSKQADEKASNEKRKQGDSSKSGQKSSSGHPPPYGMPPHPYGHPEGSYYPPMPPGMPHGGSMRVVVGGPPPSRSKSSPSRSPPGPRPYPMGPGDPNYPPPPYPPPGHYPHHPGVPPHMHSHYGHYGPPPHGPPRHMPMYGAQHPPGKSKAPKKAAKPAKPTSKRPVPVQTPKPGSAKKQKKTSPSSAPKRKNRSPQLTEKADRQKAAATIQAVNQASGGKNDKAAALAAAILRGVTMRPSGKWQAQLYFAGKSRYIGVFDTREKAALAYEIAREKLKAEKQSAEGGTLSAKATDSAVNAARKAAFEGVNERDPRMPSK